VPCIVGYWGRSTLNPNGAAARVAEALGCELFCAEDAPHAAHVQHPDSFAAFVRRAVERAVGGAAPSGAPSVAPGPAPERRRR